MAGVNVTTRFERLKKEVELTLNWTIDGAEFLDNNFLTSPIMKHLHDWKIDIRLTSDGEFCARLHLEEHKDGYRGKPFFASVFSTISINEKLKSAAHLFRYKFSPIYNSLQQEMPFEELISPLTADSVMNFKIHYKIIIWGQEVTFGGIEARPNEPIKQSWLNLDEYLFNETFSDLEIMTLDGGVIKAHKMILSAQSSVFSRMLSPHTQMEESINSTIKIDDFSEDIVRKMLKYFYTGVIEGEELGELFQMVEIGEKYEISGLVNKCKDRIMRACENTGSTEDMVDIFENILQKDIEFLKPFAFRFLIKNKKNLAKSPKYRDFCKRNPGIVARIYEAEMEKLMD